MQLPRIQRRKATDYKKPARFNTVSVMLLMFAGLLVYLGYAFWPAIVLRSRVRSELHDVLLQVWRANLRPEPGATRELARLKKEMVVRLRKIGVTDKKLEVTMERNAKRVGLQANFIVNVHFPLINKVEPIAVSPRATTDAARVDW